jgi:hypothetical protein
LAFNTWWGLVVLAPLLIIMHCGVVLREERYNKSLVKPIGNIVPRSEGIFEHTFPEQIKGSNERIHLAPWGALRQIEQAQI